jgi:hypothetical protein
MSMSMRVYFKGPIPTTTAIEQTMAEAGLPFRITEGRPIEGHTGYLPMTFGEGDDEIETGSEVSTYAGAPTIAEIGITGVDPTFNQEIAFDFSAMMECVAAEALAAAIAQLTGGIVY